MTKKTLKPVYVCVCVYVCVYVCVIVCVREEEGGHSETENQIKRENVGHETNRGNAPA